MNALEVEGIREGPAEISPQESPVRLVDWLRKVTPDPRALEWFDGPECEGRIVRAYHELLSGYQVDTSTLLEPTRKVVGAHPGVVSVREINYYSLCAHHFLPFFGLIDVFYVPGAKIIGLGKFPRLIRAYSRRFQIQEDLVKDVAEEIITSGEARAAYVTSTGRHLCICGRGPLDHTAVTHASYILGDEELLRRYLLELGESR